MKNFLTAFAIFTSLATLQATTYTNKTFMNTPTPLDNIPLQYTSWHRLLKQGSNSDSAWGGTLQVAPFYGESTNDKGLGQYFGTNYKSEFVINFPGPTVDIDRRLLIHRWFDENGDPPTPTTMKGTITLSPKQTSYGAMINYRQDLKNVRENLFLQINAPFYYVENDPRIGIKNEERDTYTGSSKGLLDYFYGNYQQDATLSDGKNIQTALTHAKIDGAHNKSGIANLEVELLYEFAQEKDYELEGCVGLTLPTGNKPDGKSFFEPVVGNNKHWGITLGGQSSLNITRKAEESLEFLCSFKYSYLFKSDEKRTLGYRNGIAIIEDIAGSDVEDSPAVLPWAWYILGGQNGAKGTFPLANILTRDVDVSPGGKLCGTTAMAYHKNNVTFDFGYSFISAEGEKVRVKNWENDKYAPSSPTYQTYEAFHPRQTNSGTSYFMGLGAYIQEHELDTSVAETPGYFKSAVHGAISYTMSDRTNPFMFGAGFLVDWTQDNGVPTGYMIWGKVGLAF